MATPAIALPIAEVPANTADWATTPYSPLEPVEVAASGNDLQLTFDDDAGGLNAAGDVGTGFTMVQPSSSDPTYYVPQNLQVANGSLNIAATKGIAYLKNGTAASDIDKNKQDNTLGVGLTASDNVLRFTTTLKSPSTSTSSAQAGIWFGPTDDDYVKLVLASPSDTGRQIQLSREVAGVTNQAVNGDQRNFDISKAALGDQDVQLILDVNSVTKSAIASYKIGAGAVTSLGTLPLPTNFFDGTLLSADVPNVDSFGGLFATKRNMAATNPLTYSFQDFSVSELDAMAPAAPGAVTAGATPDSVELTWAAPADADVAGYRVYRSGTTPVATTGTPVSGAELITDPSFVDESAFVGGTYHYSVIAVDTSGNTSAAAESGAAVPPAPPGTLVDKINFQPSAANVPDGYSADTGAAYDAARGSGWITEDDRTPFDFSLNTRSRTGNPDPRLSSIIHMQYGDIASASPTTGVTAEKGVWEYDVPNGTYNVVTAVGDTGAGVTNNYDSKHLVRAEGTVVLEEFVGSAPRQFDEAVGTVEVTDGKLTIDAIGGSNTKLAYIDIYSVTQEAPVPAAPAGLQGEAGASGVVLEWTASEGAAGYNVYRGTTAEVAVDGPALNGDTPVSGVTFTDESAAADTTYYYVVVAVNEDGAASDPSSAVEVQVPAEETPVPAAPVGVKGAAGETGVVLEWTASQGAAGYNVYRGTTAEVAVDGPALNGDTPVSGVTFTDESAAADTTYYYVVTAVNEERAASDPSQAVEVTVPPEGGPEPGACAVGQWTAEFFQGRDLAGAPVTIECADDIDQAFGVGSGPEGVGSTNYSIRWTKTVTEGAGTYEFRARTDDGVRIKVDDELVLDQWVDQSATETHTASVTLDESAKVEVEYYQGWGSASADVSYTRVGEACAVGQWTAEFFQGRDLAGAPVTIECADDIDQAFGVGSGPEGVGSTNYSIRWTKTVTEGAGTYEFRARTDDGVRIKVDDELVLDQWVDQSATETHTASVTLDESAKVEVEYYQGWGSASADVSYTRVGEACAVGQWTAEFFQGRDLAGAPVTIECADDIDQAFGVGSGPEGVGSTNYSIRWTKTVTEGAGTYEFRARTDDGVRIKVDDELVLDQWVDQSATETHTASVTLDESAKVEVEYYQGWGSASADVSYTRVGEACAVGQWTAEFFQGRDLAGAPVTIECADDIDQAFGVGSGPEGVGSTNYSIRWTKTVTEGAGTYEFRARTDDGVRIKVDDELVLDQWVDQSATETHTASVTLDESAKVEVEYYQGWGSASADVSYTRVGADTEAPSAPSQLVAAAEDSAVALSWEVSASTDTVGYRVYRGTEAGVEASETPLSGSPLVENASYRDVSAAPDVTYYYVVTAVDAAGNESEVSNEAMAVVATVEDTEAPDAPLELAAVAGDASVELTWTASASTDTAGYRVYRSLQPVVADTGEEDAVSGEALVSGTAYTDDTVSNGTTYFYVVTAVDTAGNESEVSNEVFAVPTVPNTTDVKVDFTATNAVPAAGYLADWGQSYGSRTSPNQGTGLSYGWLSEDGTPVSLVGNGRERVRTGIDGRLNSILHMQYGDVNGTNGVNTEGVWELAVPNGLYEVEVAVGDEPGASNVYDSNHVINIEAGLGIESFQATAGEEYRTSTTTVGVWDGALTLTATGGTNTKIAYVEVLGLEQAPHVDTMRPDNRASGHDPNDGVSATIRVPYAGVGVDPQTLPGNVHIYEAASGVEVPSSTGTSGGNDVISTQPDSPLKPNTSYRFVVTDEVKDNFGAPFVPFSSIFTTGAGTVETPEEFTPLSGVGFEKVELPIGAGTYWSTFTFGPDDKLYGATIGQGLFRFTVNDDGTLSNKENLGYQGRAMVGLVFDKSSTASDLKLWITSTSANVGNEQGQWISGISRLTGANLQNEAKIFEGLPRSQSDHLTNSMVYGPDGRLYFQQGSNQAAGDLDNSWGQRGEKLLTAATLVFDPANPQVQAAASGAGSINVQTADGGSYDPYASNAPLKIYATGIRNAYDLVWHSNGHLYVPTNGTAGGGNSPGVTANADGTFTRVAAPGIPGASTVNGRDVTAQCQRRNYTGGSVPAIANHPTQRDLLFDVVEGGYYGHPNPERCEWVLNEGNDPANLPESPGQGGSKYASGVKADPNYRGIAYDFEFNKSPNGALEYQSDTFGGQLKGRLLVTRFSNNNDLIFLQPDPATGEILGAQVPTGVPGVPNTTISGADGFNDPLEVVEDPGTGNLYVNQYDRSGGAQKMFLLRVPADQQAATLDASAEELVFSTVKNTTSSTKAVTVTNTGPEAVTLSRAVQGAQAGEFTITGGSTSLAPGASTTLQVAFKPGSAVGQRSATLEVTAGDTTLEIGLYGLSMNGIEGGNEPTFADVLGTLGYKVDVGWTNLAGGVDPAAKGDEVLEPLFVKSGSAPVSMKPLAQYAPREDLPFGWYTGDGTESERNKVGSIDINGYQSLLPPASPGSASSFDPGDEQFGFYFYSNVFQRVGFTEDRLNTGIAHRARVYPAKDRSGAAMANSYIVAFEDASNGDYQDYVFLVQGVKPAGEVTPPSTEAIRVNFSDLAGPLPAGYLRDHGQAFGTRTAPDQGTGLSYGWKSQATENPLDISTGGTTPGNGRTRVTAQTDQRLESLMHMQSGDVSGTFNGVATYAYWEIALPDGEYRVTVAAGDATINSDLEAHSINFENQPVISRFVPTGAAGANSRHATATADVAVTDGFLTVDANGGTNSKINYLDIVPLADTEVPGDDPTDGAQVKVNFQTPAAPTPAGWTADTGMAFDAERKFGWLVDGAPTDRSSAARYRTTATPGINYPSDPLLQTTNLMGPASNVSTGVWEYELPNGTYKVALSVGDSGFLDSTHGVAVEGQPLVNSFVPTGATPFQTGTRDVAVADGKLTVTSTGTNSKINWISIKGDGLDGPPAETTLVKYNFQTEAAPTPAGWIKDYGLGYSAGAGFGWLVGGEPADRVLSGRYRTAAASGITYPANDPLLQTLNIMQSGTVTGLSDGTWVADVADGTYTVSVSVGDAGFLDSTHAIEVEGTPVIDPFVPTGSAPFKTGTAQVTVTDGQLTVVPTGTNTKINWITIAGKALTAPSVAVTVNGTEIGSSFSGGTANVSLAATAPTGTTIESLTYSVNGADPVAYTAPFVFDTAGNYVLEVTATDTTGASTTRTVQFEVLDIGGTLTLRNEQVTRQGGAPIPGLSEDWLVMHRINGGVSTHEVVDEATVTLSNTGSKGLRITELALGGPNAGQFTVTDAPELPFTVQPNASVPVTVQFTAASGGKGVRVAQLNVRSSDPSAALMPVQLRGAYMTQPEGNSELSVNEIALAFGWTTDLGSPSNGDEMRTSALNGEEVRSLQWKRLDSSIPVTARQIAAFHGCCTQIETVNINGTTATHNAAYGQSLLPLNNALTGPTQLTTNPTGNIGIVVSGQSTNNPNYMAVKTWPVRDRDRKIVPGAWIVGHDYISSPNQCGTGPTNCDFQDNMYLVTNMVPVASSDTTAPSTVTGVAAAASGSAIDVTWAAGPEADLAGYYVERATSAAGPWTRISGNTPVRGLKMTDTNLPFAAQAFYRVQAVDASGNTSPVSATASAAIPASAGQAIRINAGGGAVTTGGVNWLADTYFAGGKTYTNPAVTQIAGTDSDALYFSERSATTGPGTFGYNIPVPAGNYTVRLHFAEIYHGATGGGAGGTGKRVFGVNLEGGPQEISNLDLNAVVSPMTAHIVSQTLGVTDGNLDIDFASTVDQPKISAIEVIRNP
ncbi:PA14 domain-containing protein [Arthrobacter antioxidans]|uniref:PA14 domain-containing protein n=1 Tax=Arthrobacter antioxidans TaxID=2895818 RepID=UPI0020000443|nr:PA14 domain-containing protein [Arthrobacter antioxidans]